MTQSGKIDLRTLDLATRARQLARPEGEVGMALADLMNQMNGAINAAAFRTLAPQCGHRLLEIGFGNGKLIPQLLSLAAELRYCGIDNSPTMLAEAAANNRTGIDAGQVALKSGTSSALPLADESFDRALAINVVYFWEEPARDMAEIFRVLAPGGLFVFNSMTPAFAATMPHVRPEFGFRIHDAPRLTALAEEAGFTNVTVEVVRYMGVSSSSSQPSERIFHLVTARKA